MQNARIRFKVCCVRSASEARVATRHGAWAVGLVSHMPSGPGVIDDRLIQEIAEHAPSGLMTVLLTSQTEADAIIRQVETAGVRAVQLCARTGHSTIAAIRDRLPETLIMPVVHVQDRRSVDEALALAGLPEVDRLLLDSGRPDAAVSELGGTGRVHDWRLSAEIVHSAGIPVLLAGGLRPTNVAEAVRQVGPWGVDVCTGIRDADLALDETRLAAFVAAVG